MRSAAETRSRWSTTFSISSNLSDLRAAVRSSATSNPCINGLRSVCWKAFLVFENLDRSTWSKTTNDSRSAYQSLKDHFLRDIRHSDELSADPLADDPNSPWNTLRRDEVLRAEILQDVERCMPDNPWFRESNTQAILLDILFVFCKLNADVGYRQGMHEVLAPVLWVVSQDAIDVNDQDEGNEEEPDDELMIATLDSNYIEHDAFTVFCIIMQTAKSFYETASNSQSSATRASENSPIVERSKRIHESYLRRTDKELTEHLTAIDILPQIFVIRWIRLLFGREFPFDDVLSLWDIIFAEDPTLNLVDLVCAAMLLRVRWQLLEADYSSALTLLLRYPVPESPHGPTTFVEDAIYLRKHLDSEGGAFLINKYTGRHPSSRMTAQRTGCRQGLHTPQSSIDSGRTRSPLRSPQFLSDPGSIENMLQDAARGAFKRSEQWGTSIRGAIQNLQQGNNSPRRSLGNIRWPLDNGTPKRYQADSRIKMLEDRNKTLAKMLQEAMEDLSAQARNFEEKKAEAEANALTLTIAKLQYLHVYLDDSSMPLNSETEEQDEKADNAGSVDAGTETLPSPVIGVESPSTEAPGSREIDQSRRSTSPPHISVSPTRSKPVRRRPPNVSSAKASGDDGSGSLESPFHTSRPTLAESSFSWMLGHDRSKTDFVSASPFAPEQLRKNSPARGKTGFLFGDDSNDKTKEKSTEDKEDEDGFTMGTLKGVGRS